MVGVIPTVRLQDSGANIIVIVSDWREVVTEVDGTYSDVRSTGWRKRRVCEFPFSADSVGGASGDEIQATIESQVRSTGGDG